MKKKSANKKSMSNAKISNKYKEEIAQEIQPEMNSNSKKSKDNSAYRLGRS